MSHTEGPFPASARRVAMVVYTAVLLGGLYYGLVIERPVAAGRLAGFTAVLAALFALEAAVHRRGPSGQPARAAAGLLLVRLPLFVLAVALEGSGVARALYVLIPFAAYFAFGAAVALALAGACTALLLTGYSLTVPGWYTEPEYVSDLVMFTLGLAMAVSMAAMAAGEQGGRLRLEESHRRLAAYADRVAELSTAAERNRLAREIHDSLGHHLTAVAIQLEKAAAFTDRDPPVAARALADARWSADRALAEVRRSVRALGEDGPLPFSLPEALAELVRHAGGREEPRIDLEISGEGTEGYRPPALTALYRAAQEGLTNACRHAAASRISVSLDLGPSAARLVVSDDGRGIGRPPEPGAGFGLRAMRERVGLLGGSVEVAGPPGGGTTLTVTVPRTAGP
ncbi:sensor histidine kinase [Streptomyces aidingensis]|uniref:Oxygen sensor histidine kinase NreB n=1 Tax=Streptomyces aidingensis TaxID=910347 RepID=A0A1I1S3Y4_9ACTN|nr:sensor histidine kinase [Streptomyces aidingensis]SFD39258.1 Signal transduction histidine kinase [Streptomyces aidingensis]